MSIGVNDVWGFDPGVVRRYAEFVTWTQGGDPNNATQYVSFQSLAPTLAMLRLKYAVAPAEQGLRIMRSDHEPLPHLLLVSDYVVRRGRDEIFAVLGSEGFDPRRTVLLEEEPEPRPDSDGAEGTVRIAKEGSDFLEIEADVPAPAILLVTDCWTPSWRAVALPGSSQRQYDVLPADYALQGIPLAAGRHKFRLEYAPWGYRIGAMVSLVASAAWLAAGGWFARRQQ
jgi:hypothetical protein